MDNSIDDMEDNIRPPDEVRVEKLLEDTRSDFEKDIDRALYLSFQEVMNQEEINRKYEEQLINEYTSEVNKRKEKFSKFLLDLNRLIKFDKDIKEIYDIIEPIIDSYCLQHINICELDKITYEKIFKLLNKTRTDKDALELLKTIIIKE